MQTMPYSLIAELERVTTKGAAPVHLWHPEDEKDIDLVVQRHGTWLYMGTPITRPRLVRLFASVLRMEKSEAGDDYYLVTPVEKCRIKVEDVPFQVLLMDVASSGKEQQLSCTTDMAEVVPIDAEHPLRIAVEDNEWIPYLHIRGGMEARFTRNVYYQLAELLVVEAVASLETDWFGVWSGGRFFPLMPVTEDTSEEPSEDTSEEPPETGS